MSYSTGLVAYYKLNASGKDSFGGNTLTETSMTYTTGKIGSCGVFGGASILTRSGKILTGSTGTIAGWIKSSSFVDGGRIFGYGGDGANAILSFEIRNLSGNKISVTTRPSSGGTANIVNGGTSLSANTWYHVGLTSNGSIYKLYVNGALETTSIFQGLNNGLWANSITTTNAFTTLGCLFNNALPVVFFVGNMDEVGLWDRELDLSEMLGLYNSGSGIDLFNSNSFFQFFSA
jgi:hypothetical protein